MSYVRKHHMDQHASGEHHTGARGNVDSPTRKRNPSDRLEQWLSEPQGKNPRYRTPTTPGPGNVVVTVIIVVGYIP